MKIEQEIFKRNGKKHHPTRKDSSTVKNKQKESGMMRKICSFFITFACEI